MTKTDLVTSVARSTKILKADVETVLNEALEEIVSALARGEVVNVSGFGIFENVIVPARMARNPRTGEPVQMREGRRVKFKASRKVIERLPVTRT